MHGATKPVSLLECLDAEISAGEAQIAALTQRIEKLRAARELLAEPARRQTGKESGETSPQAKDEPSPKVKLSLAELIERILLDGAPLDAANVFSQITASGQKTSLGTVNTTLSKMKSQGKVINEKRLWDLTPTRRKALASQARAS